MSDLESAMMTEKQKHSKRKKKDAIFTTDRTVSDLQKQAQNPYATRFDPRQIRERGDYVSDVLGDFNTSQELRLTEEERKRLKNAKARGLSHLLLSDDTRPDSQEMAEVKYRIGELEELIHEKKGEPVTPINFEEIEVSYSLALNACEDYLHSPEKKEGRRKEAVQNAYQALKEEAERLKVQRERLLEGLLTQMRMGDILSLDINISGNTAVHYHHNYEEEGQQSGADEEPESSSDEEYEQVMELFKSLYDPAAVLGDAGSNEGKQKALMKKYQEAQKILLSLSPDQVCVKDVELLGKKVKLLQRSDNSLSIVVGHREVALSHTAEALAEKIEGALVQGKTKPEAGRE